ncbi:MAG: radical SAM protein [Candidatus Omnitrophica bacterium]|nr:radical SAM protein [Candidatus Omnitrophota bacterium]
MNSKFRIKLVWPPNYNIGYNFFVHTLRLPLGIATLKSFLDSQGYYVELADLLNILSGNKKDSWYEIRKDLYYFKEQYHLAISRIERYLQGIVNDKEIERLCSRIVKQMHLEKFNLVGFSIMSSAQFITALLLAKNIKQYCNIPIVLGGSYITMNWPILSESFNYVDYLIAGDGEVSLLELIRLITGEISDVTKVSGLIYKRDGKCMNNEARFIPINSSCIPTFKGLTKKIYYITKIRKKLIIPYAISRGCSQQCIFCTIPSEKLQLKSTEKCISEITALKKQFKTKFFNIIATDLNLSPQMLDDFCISLIKKKVDIIWRGEARGSSFDRDRLMRLKKSGCCELSFGIESGSNNLLTRLKKGFTIEEAEYILKESHKVGIKNTVFLVAGFPHETEDDITKTVSFLEKNRSYINLVLVKIFTLRYNSYIYHYPQKHMVENLRRISLFDIAYCFDEINGLKWEDKKKQQLIFFQRVNTSIENMRL